MPDDKKDEKKKDDGTDERYEYIQNYLAKSIRLKSDKWSKMIQTEEYKVKYEFIFKVFNIYSIYVLICTHSFCNF